MMMIPLTRAKNNLNEDKCINNLPYNNDRDYIL